MAIFKGSQTIIIYKTICYEREVEGYKRRMKTFYVQQRKKKWKENGILHFFYSSPNFYLTKNVQKVELKAQNE